MDFKGKNSALRQKPTPEVLPASQYLQDRLLERRARNVKRTRQSDFGPRMNAGYDDDLFFAEAEESRHAPSRMYDSSPLASMSRFGSDNVSNGNGNNTLSAGGRKRRTPGARELDEQMDRLTKQNFDLKLELDHRRENQAKLLAEIESMRATVERAERLEDEHEELMRINSLLVEELEKRDKAIQEAADIICDLEEKVEDYEESRAVETRPSTAHADSGYAGTETHEHMLLSSPPEVAINPPPRQTTAAATSASGRLNSAVQAQTPARPRREPAFLAEQKPSTTALRSVYLDAGKGLHPVTSFNSILSKRASTIDENALAEEVLNSPRLSALSESSFPSIYGKKDDTPEKYDWEELPESTRPYGSAHSRQDSISRVNQWIEDRETMVETPSKSNRISSPVPTATVLPTPRLLRRPAERSTRMLRPSRSSIVGERSLPVVNPAQVKSYAPIQPRPSVAQRPMQSSVDGEVAYNSNADLRPGDHNSIQTTLDRAAMDVEDSESDADDYYSAESDTLQDIGPDYDGYPDGNSITGGTPSRFLKHNKQISVSTDMFFNSADVSPPSAFDPGTQSAQRRKSSSEVTSSPLSKPGFHRADTSPQIYGSLGRRVGSGTARPATSYSPISPQSYDSASSSVRTARQDRHFRSLSPEPAHHIPPPINTTTTTTPSPPNSRPQPSPIPTSASRTSFTQKTQSLFRRLSNTPDEQPRSPRLPTRREREKSPLPTLTSTPSAAYHQRGDREIRRPNTSASMRPGSSVRAVSKDRSSRPAISPRTMTDPSLSAGEVETSSVTGLNLKRGLFRRGGSFKQQDVGSVKNGRR